MDTRDRGSNSQEDVEENQLPAGKLPSNYSFFLAFILFLSLSLCFLLRENIESDKTSSLF